MKITYKNIINTSLNKSYKNVSESKKKIFAFMVKKVCNEEFSNSTIRENDYFFEILV